MEKTILNVKKIYKNFYSNKALQDVDFDVREGEIHALAGENGAGKSTMMNILLGSFPPSSGEMFFMSESYKPKDPHEALQKGISMIHQEIELVPSISVAENVWVGRFEKFKKGGLYLKELCVKETEKLFKEIGIDLDPNAIVKTLSIAQMQMVEIARAISYDSKIVIMDEPTSSLSDKEVQVLYTIIRKLSSQGKAIIFISHKIEEIFEICDRVTVFRDGHKIATKDVKDTTPNELISLIAGRDMKNLYPKEDMEIGETVFKVVGLTQNNKFENISFEVGKGEILGFAGLVGAGRTEIMSGIFGIEKLDKGEIYLEGKKINCSSPSKAIKNGIGMVTEDRLRRGVIKNLSVKFNLTVANLFRLIRYGFIQNKQEDEETEKMITQTRIKTANPDMPIWSLSGGNQQKVMIGRALMTNPKVLILDEPTRGIDVGSKNEVYHHIMDLAKQGIAIILISSELSEVMGMADRIEVVREGKIVAEHLKNEATQEQIVQEMFGIEKGEVVYE